MMLGRFTAQAARRGLRATPRHQRRNMGGGGHYMEVSEFHRSWGEAFGVVCWLWVFHRARNDLPILLGFRHPWEHAEDPFAPHAHGHAHAAPDEKVYRQQQWDKFSERASIQKEVDDEDEEEDDEEGDDDD